MIDVLLKFLHILGAVLMVGNVITTGLWAHWAVSADNEALRRCAARSILKADIFLTFVGGGLVVIPGMIMVARQDLPFMSTPWIVQGAIALVVSTLVWIVFLIPDQLRMQKHAEAQDREAFEKAYRRWSILGWFATIPLIYALWVMVAR